MLTKNCKVVFGEKLVFQLRKISYDFYSLLQFDGASGEEFQRAAATFCARQQIALESLKERRRKDQKLHAFLNECESDKLCKRLQLKDIIPTGKSVFPDKVSKCISACAYGTSLHGSIPSATPRSSWNFGY